MTTLIVGCGYLGRRVAVRLIARGERVLGTTRSPGGTASLIALGVESVILDVLDPSLSVRPEFDRLVYCVGFDRRAGVPIRTVYVEGLRRLLRWSDGRDARFVYTSSTSVYGQDDGSWVTEVDPTEPRNESGRSCLEAESAAMSRGATIVRLAGLYGPGRIIRRAALLAGEAIVGDPGKRINLIHVDDAAAATIAALNRGEPARVYNVADDRPVERRELYTWTASCLDAPPPRFVHPNPLPNAAAEDVDRRISNRRLKDELGVALRYPDITTGLPASVKAEAATPPPR